MQSETVKKKNGKFYVLSVVLTYLRNFFIDVSFPKDRMALLISSLESPR